MFEEVDDEYAHVLIGKGLAAEVGEQTKPKETAGGAERGQVMEIDWDADPSILAKVKLQARVETDEEDELVRAAPRRFPMSSSTVTAGWSKVSPLLRMRSA